MADDEEEEDDESEESFDGHESQKRGSHYRTSVHNEEEEDASSEKSSSSGDDRAGEDDLFEIKVPHWVEVLAGAIGLRDFQYKLAVERGKRTDEFYQNPYPITNSMVTHVYFEVIIGFLILMNCVVLGWEASVADGENEALFSFLEILFTVVFLVEWCMRLLAFGWSWPFTLANAVDTWLVFGTGIFLKPLAILKVNVEGLRLYTALRALRLVKLARVVRYEPQFKELWVLVQGMMTSTRAITWVSVVAVVLLYTFAVIGTELVGRNPVFQDDPVAMEYFGSLGSSMLTTVQMITLDSWCDDIARPILEKSPTVMMVYFLLFIGLCVFVFWNLITAVVVENAMEIINRDTIQQSKDAETRKIDELKALKDLFLTLDEDKSGRISEDEFFSALDKPQLKMQMDLLDLKAEEMGEIWDLLDDGDGELTIKEFTDGLRRMKGGAKAKDVYDCMKRLEATYKFQVALKERVKKLCRTYEEVEDISRQIQKDTQEVTNIFMEMFYRLNTHVAKGKKEDKVAQGKRKAEQAKADRKALLETLEEGAEHGNNDG